MPGAFCATGRSWAVLLLLLCTILNGRSLRSQEPQATEGYRIDLSAETRRQLEQLCERQPELTFPVDELATADLEGRLRAARALRIAALQGLVESLELCARHGAVVSPDLSAPLTFVALARTREELAKAEADSAGTLTERIAALKRWRSAIVTLELEVRERMRVKANGGSHIALFQIASQRLQAEECVLLELIRQRPDAAKCSEGLSALSPSNR